MRGHSLKLFYYNICSILCNEIYDDANDHLKHDINQNSIEVDPLDRHDIPRHELKRVSFLLLYLCS